VTKSIPSKKITKRIIILHFVALDIPSLLWCRQIHMLSIPPQRRRLRRRRRHRLRRRRRRLRNVFRVCDFHTS